MLVRVRSASSGKLENSGTAFRTAVETVVVMATVFCTSLCENYGSRTPSALPEVCPPASPIIGPSPGKPRHSSEFDVFAKQMPTRHARLLILGSGPAGYTAARSEEHTSELQSRGLISYAV